MAVASISSWYADPARRSEFVGRLVQARRFHEAYGGRVHIWNNSVAGETVGIIEYWIIHDDFAAYGRFSAALAADEDYNAWFRQLTEGDAGGRVISTRLMQTVD